jgi:glutamate carboxypeptidase
MSYSIDSGLVSRLQKHLEDNQPAYLDLLRQMVAINSFTANPSGVNRLGQLTAQTFAELGFSAEAVQCETITYGKHLILTRPGRSARKIGLVSHLDTVFPPDEEEQHNFVWRVDGDRIYGPGTVDIKGGTALIYMMLAALQEILPRVFEEYTWVVLLNAAEETVSADFPKLCLERLSGSTAACLVFEMGHLQQNEGLVVVARKGMAIFRVVVEGRAAHAGSAHPSGASAVVQLAKTIQQIDALTDYERHITFNVGTIAGGTVLNRVPHYAVASGEMRAFSPAVYDEGLQKLLALADQVSVSSPDDGFPCTISIEIMDQTPPWPRNQATDQLLAIWQEAGRLLDLRIGPQERGGLSDGNAIWSFIPTLDGLGPSGGNAHCSEHSPDGGKEQEYVTPSSFVPKALLNIVAILKLIDSPVKSQ